MNTQTIKDLLEHVTSECSAIDVEARFDDMLDQSYSFDSVGGGFEYLSPSKVMKEMMPTDYRCGCADYSDSEEWFEINGDYYDQAEVEKARESFLSDLESEESDKEAQIEDANEADQQDEELIDELGCELCEIQAKIKEVRDYTF